jgi:hypothetical protein
VPRAEILRLYEAIAQGILDEDLIDEVAYAFYARCQDMQRIAERRIEALIAANRQQQATARLAEIAAYQGELLVLPGDLPREMVKSIKREMKQCAS